MKARLHVVIMKISFDSYEKKTNFHMESFALSLALLMRGKAIRKWPIKC